MVHVAWLHESVTDECKRGCRKEKGSQKSYLSTLFLVVVDVVNFHGPASDFCATEIVHCKNGAALIFICQKGKAPGLACVLVPVTAT